MPLSDRLRRVFSRASGREYVEGHSPSDSSAARGSPVRKGRSDSPIAKDEPERRASLPPELERQIKNRNGAMKPYDPHWLKDLSKNWVAQAYIDTMAQDAATAPWTLQVRDDRNDVDEEEIIDAERKLQSLHPEKSFRDLREMAARNTLRMGDGAWLKHYYSNGELAEVVPVDSARLYKQVDEHGMTNGYLQVRFSQMGTGSTFDLEEVVWFEWASREDHVYGEGPVEKGEELIRLIEELKEKEKKDLEEGMPPGIVSVKEDEDTPLAVDSYETVKDNWDLKEGERHRAIVSMGDWQFTPLDAGYQELQFMERNKMWIQSLGAVFKVNAPYAGFDFQEGNRAQNEAQHEAAKQRGFTVLLRQMEEAINRQLIWTDISEDLEFVFETAQTVEEKQQEAQHQQELARAAEEWDKLGRDVTLRDGRLDIEDGPVEAPEETDDGGGPFGFSADSSKDTLDGSGPSHYFHDREAAEAFAPELGLEGAHRHESDDPRVGEWMPGSTHDAYERAVYQPRKAETLDDLDFAGYPDAASENAQMALDAREETGNPNDCGTQTGWARANQLANGEALSPETVGRMANFRRHQGNADMGDEGRENCGWMMWKAWGGEEGVAWAERMVERMDEITASVDEGGSGGKSLTKEEVEKLDEVLLSAHRSQIQPESLADIEKRSWSGEDSVPQYVLDTITAAIDGGAVFSDIEGIPDRTVERLEDVLGDALTQPQGWSTRSLVDRMKDIWPGVSEQKLETVARTETASVLNRAREEGYDDSAIDGEPLFYWTGPEDTRTTPVCTGDGDEPGLKELTNPRFGGEPLTMPDLIREQKRLHDKHFTSLRFRRHVPHVNCRHSFVRYVEQ